MHSYITIIRGINVSGHKVIKMNELKMAMETIDLTAIKTYIQSGNMVFQSNKTSARELSEEIAGVISERFGFEVPVITFSVEEWQHVITHNPMVDDPEVDQNKLHVTFLDDLPTPELIRALSTQDFHPDSFIIDGRVIYLYCPGNYGKTKLSNHYFENKLKVRATTRNWRTTLTLLKMAVENQEK